MSGRVGVNIDLNLGILVMKSLEQRGQPMVAGIAFRAQANDAARAAVETFNLSFRTTQLPEYTTRAQQQLLSRGREHHLLPQPEEERRAQFFLRIAQLMN